jgi:hypothetical protein
MRRIGMLLGALAVPALLAAGCRSAEPVAAGTATPPPPASTSTPEPGPTSAPPPAGNGVTYPRDYHGAVMDAWVARDASRLALLTSDPEEFLAIDRHRDQQWSRRLCDGAMGGLYCAFENRDGDVIVIRVDSAELSQHRWHAARLQIWDPIRFPTGAKAYADAFLHAWIDGYPTRMSRLAVPGVVAHFNGLQKADYTYSISTEGAAGHTYAHVTSPAGFDQTITLLNDKVSRGLPRAVDGIATQ